MKNVWHVGDVYGLMARFVADDSMTRLLARQRADTVNTDDRNLLEFSAARSVGATTPFQIAELRSAAAAIGADRPPVRGNLDEARLRRARMNLAITDGRPAYNFTDATESERAYLEAMRTWSAGSLGEAYGYWQQSPWEAQTPGELVMTAEILAEAGDEAATAVIEKLMAVQPTEALAIRARYAWKRGDNDQAADDLVQALARYRSDPWPMPEVMLRSIALVDALGLLERERYAPRLFAALEQPFVLRLADANRLTSRLFLATRKDQRECTDDTLSVLEKFEPWPPWDQAVLQLRKDCYSEAGHPLAERAREEWDEFLDSQPVPILQTPQAAAGLVLEPPTPRADRQAP